MYLSKIDLIKIVRCTNGDLSLVVAKALAERVIEAFGIPLREGKYPITYTALTALLKLAYLLANDEIVFDGKSEFSRMQNICNAEIQNFGFKES